MKINEVRFLGFNRNELRAIRKQTGKSGEDELTVFIMQGSTAIVKAGE